MKSKLLTSIILVFLLFSCQKEEIILDTKENSIALKANKKSTINDFAIKKKPIKAELLGKDFPFKARGGHTSEIFNNKMWIIAGALGGSIANDVWSSEDGYEWKEQTPNAQFPGRHDHASTVFNDKLWVIGGRGVSQNGTDKLNDVWQSDNGQNWTEVTTKKKFAPRFWHTLTSFNDCMWLIGGWGENNITFGDVWRSCDGINWNKVMNTSPFGKRRGHKVVVFDNKLWLIGGIKNETINGITTNKLMNDVWFSENGITWFQGTDNANFSARRSHELTTDGELLWLSAGNTNEISHAIVNDLWYSKNGLDWFEVDTPDSFQARQYHSMVSLENRLFVINGLGLDKNSFHILPDIWSFSFKK